VIDGAVSKWAEIDLSAIGDNTRAIVRLMAGTGTAVMAVVKANGYGHGAVEASRAALTGGATWLAVSSVAEGLQLREAKIEAPILQLGYTPPRALAEAVAAGLSLTVYEMGTVRALRELPLPAPARLHLKVDTGMHRLGASAEDALALAQAIREAPNLELEGVFTHFASAADDPTFTREQLGRFLTVRDRIQRDTGLRFLSHAANSAGLLRVRESRLDLVRAGLLIYGISPDPGWVGEPAWRPALSWRTLVTNVLTVPAGETVGYGRTWTASGPRRVATLAVGYADGVQRRQANRGRVLIRGRLVPIVGAVSMDQTAADVTDVPGVSIGDVATLIGRDGASELTASAVAVAVDTISWEVLCAISARVVRRYVSQRT